MKFIALSLLIGFVAIVFFSLPSMAHSPSGEMDNNCLFSTVNISLCSRDIVASVVHHISSYESFLSAPINFNATIFLVSLLFVVYIAAVSSANSLLFKPFVLANNHYNPLSVAPGRKIIRWLSLFENSPSPL